MRLSVSRSEPIGWHAVKPWRALVALSLLVAAMLAAMPPAAAQEAPEAAAPAAQECVDCVRYAGTELNLRQEPSLEGAVLRFVPKGAEVQLTGEAEQNGYLPVTYDRVPGWVIALALVPTAEEVATFVVPDAPPATEGAPVTGEAPATGDEPVAGEGAAASAETRLTLSALLLRSGPGSDAEPILTMPEGSAVMLTREGAENGYVTVDYGGVIGWAYADLLAEPGEV